VAVHINNTNYIIILYYSSEVKQTLEPFKN